MLTDILGRTTTICIGVAGLAFVGYCLYFDKKRRSDPQYKEKLRERRKKQRTSNAQSTKSAGGGRAPPDMSDSQAVQAYFLQEIQTGEAKLALGMEDEGIEHLVNAVTICGQPHQLLQVLQQTLPAKVFQKLIASLPTGPSPARPPPQPASGPILQEVEDDLE